LAGGESPGMALESGRHEAEPWSADLVRSIAVSSPELRHEILERLREVQEGQAKLADAIEVVEMMVHDALDSEAVDRLGAPAPDTPSEEPSPHNAASSGPSHLPDWDVALASMPDPEQQPDVVPEPVVDVPLGFKDSAGPADSEITSVAAPAQRAWSGAEEVREPAVDTGVPEPVFYVPSFDEEVLPATSVAELTSGALDAALASEFGSGSGGASTVASVAATEAQELTAPDPAIPHADTRQFHEPAFEHAVAGNGSATVAPTSERSSEHNKVLDILLGTPRTADDAQSHVDAAAVSSSTASNATLPPPVVTSHQSTIVMASPPPPPPPVPTPAQVVTPDVAPSSAPLSATADVPAVSTPTSELPPPSSPPVFLTQDPLPTVPAPVLSPPTAPLPAPPVPVSDAGPLPSSLDQGPVVGLVPPAPLLGDTPFEKPSIQVNGRDPLPTFDDSEVEAVFTTDESHHLNSAASMATEILSASPDIATVGTAEDPESEIISKDVTLIARGRKKRFRLH